MMLTPRYHISWSGSHYPNRRWTRAGALRKGCMRSMSIHLLPIHVTDLKTLERIATFVGGIRKTDSG